MKLGIGKKLFGVIAFLIVTLIGLSAFFLANITRANDEQAAMYQKDFHDVTLVAEIDGLLTRIDINILRMIAIGDPASIIGWKQENIERFATVDKIIDDLLSRNTGEQLASVKSLQASYQKMQAGMKHQVQLLDAGDIKGSSEVNRLEVKDKVFIP